MRVGRVVRSRNALDPLGLDARRRAFCARMGRRIIAPIAPCPTERLQAGALAVAKEFPLNRELRGPPLLHSSYAGGAHLSEGDRLGALSVIHFAGAKSWWRCISPEVWL